jgi:hypothetical protein
MKTSTSPAIAITFACGSPSTRSSGIDSTPARTRCVASSVRRASSR